MRNRAGGGIADNFAGSRPITIPEHGLADLRAQMAAGRKPVRADVFLQISADFTYAASLTPGRPGGFCLKEQCIDVPDVTLK
ncbi:hypothetical protein TNCT6_40240 [Streptomyces sp. 6-11-2]|nr:hypothetical protein TNCT6_40240 [Streptomyces sp. 6-11-2]